ncbi:dihydrofolate reductase [Aquamicrobium sp. LC103]|uniref:dihydrofolate reductase n=1 Tax=Aquamicrobium sp. LC103 TaxID=1120658 RepID=UPI00063E6D3F|nr:dihydrofolate reductase [Aquamicrobium sp. LC103]TKT80114.1 dihydrofolate reductase [Aquamicrobium sp. LC103]
MKTAIVVAIGENGVIGNDGGLPWRLSTDMKRFKAQTMGKPIIMGRKTWESFPRRPLPGRLNIVITRDGNYRAEGARVVGSLGEAIAIAREQAEADGIDEICVIGGGEIYAQALNSADTLHVTHVAAAPRGDTRFPEIDPETWYVAEEESFPAGEKDSHPTRYVVYERHRK